MKILPVTDPSFQNYGQIMTGYDLKELLETLDKVTPLPEGVEYVPEQPELQALAIEKKSHEIERTLGAVKKEFGRYEEALEKVSKSLTAATNNLDTLRTTRTNMINRALKNITECDSDLFLSDGMTNYGKNGDDF